MHMRGKKFHWYVQLLQESYSKFLSNCETFIRLTRKFAKFECNKEHQAAFDFLKESQTTVPVLATLVLANHAFSVQMLVMIALGHVSAKSSIYKGKSNHMSQMKSLFTICHINLQFHKLVYN